MRLQGKVAIVVGAGQTPGETVGNGRATAILFAREGARVMLVDRNLTSAEETRDLIKGEGGSSVAFEADATCEDACRAVAERCMAAYGQIDILHNNVGIGTGDAETSNITVEAWDQILTVNLKSVLLPCKHVLPAIRAARRMNRDVQSTVRSTAAD